MTHIHRTIEKEVLRAARAFPSLLVTGPRRAGKTTLLRKLFPKAAYYLLEDPMLIMRIREDPHAFLENVTTPAIFDEIQNIPELFNYIKAAIDKEPQRKGRWLITGSQEAPLMKGVSESMAGRVAVFQLLPFSYEETPKVSALRGGFPEVLQRPQSSGTWFRSYLQTYLERDVRAISSIRNLAVFRKFLSLLASRAGTLLNKTDLAAPLGVSVPTITEWLSILEITGQILIVPPFFENFGKRLIKSPKIYFTDTGLLCWLLDITRESDLARGVFAGPVFENFIASEVVKHQVHTGKQRQLYFFRDEQGLEVDFVIPKSNRRLLLLEAKATRTVKPFMAAPIDRLAKSISRYSLERAVVFQASRQDKEISDVLSLGVSAVPVNRLFELLR